MEQPVPLMVLGVQVKILVIYQVKKLRTSADTLMVNLLVLQKDDAVFLKFGQLAKHVSSRIRSFWLFNVIAFNFFRWQLNKCDFSVSLLVSNLIEKVNVDFSANNNLLSPSSMASQCLRISNNPCEARSLPITGDGLCTDVAGQSYVDDVLSSLGF